MRVKGFARKTIRKLAHWDGPKISIMIAWHLLDILASVLREKVSRTWEHLIARCGRECAMCPGKLRIHADIVMKCCSR